MPLSGVSVNFSAFVYGFSSEWLMELLPVLKELWQYGHVIDDAVWRISLFALIFFEQSGQVAINQSLFEEEDCFGSLIKVIFSNSS